MGARFSPGRGPQGLAYGIGWHSSASTERTVWINSRAITVSTCLAFASRVWGTTSWHPPISSCCRR